MPYLPAGVSDLPESRIILFGDENNRVRAVDESLLTRTGNEVIGKWLSPSLNRDDITRIYTLRKLMLLYEASGTTTGIVRVSGNGGETFNTSDQKTANFLITDEKVRRLVLRFNTSGFDLRFRLDLGGDVLVNITGWVAYLEKGTDHAINL